MAVEQVKQLLDLLNESENVTELSITGAKGGKVTLKRQLQPPVQYAQTEVIYESVVDGIEPVLADSPISRPSVINGTLVGLFHEANPPISLQSQVSVGQTVGYIESMRLMNEVVSVVSGTVDSVMIAEGQPVEYGQPLFAVVE